MEEIQTMDAIVVKKFRHNMMNIESFRSSYKALVASRDNDYLELEEPPKPNCSFPKYQIPEWAGHWIANNTRLNNGNSKIKVSSHTEITKAIGEGIKQTQEWQQQWEDK